ncbi:MAG: tRNA adenosine(34) deaminase TadA [Actinobacteria bacterium]|nr:tRNA adenosine(34) deaminase TadA [Actinomycetota bacterium]
MRDFDPKDEHFMALALAEARIAFEIGEVPVGCVIVLGDRIIARAHNLREKKKDPTAHAEILAIRKAARRMGGWRLLNTVMYVTVEPCAMCAGAIYQARVDRLVYGVEDPKAGAIRSLFNILDNKKINHRVEISSGVLQNECSKVLSDFFKNRRDKQG